MAPALPGGAVRAVEEVQEEVRKVLAGWEALSLELALVGIVYAPIAEPEYPIR
jgi:uncharacterized membrane protein